MAERKLVVVKDYGILPELGGIGGPILTPTRIPTDIILKMINNSRRVCECYPNDPRNESLWVELTNANYNLNNFVQVDADAQLEHTNVTPVQTETVKTEQVVLEGSKIEESIPEEVAQPEVAEPVVEEGPEAKEEVVAETVTEEPEVKADENVNANATEAKGVSVEKATASKQPNTKKTKKK